MRKQYTEFQKLQMGRQAYIINGQMNTPVIQTYRARTTLKSLCTFDPLMNSYPASGIEDAFLSTATYNSKKVYFINNTIGYETYISNKYNNKIASKFIMLDIDHKRDDLTEEEYHNFITTKYKTIIEYMSSHGFTVMNTGGGLHFYMELQFCYETDHYYFDAIKKHIKENHSIFDTQCNLNSGFMRAPGSINTKYNRQVRLIHYSDRKFELDIALFIIKKIPNLTVQKKEVITTSCITKTKTRLSVNRSKIIKMNLDSIYTRKTKAIILREFETNDFYKKATNLDVFIENPFKYKKILNKFINTFRNTYTDGNRYTSIRTFLNMLRRQGLRKIGNYIKILNDLEANGIEFTNESLSLIQYYIKNLIKYNHNANMIEYKSNPDMRTLGKQISKLKEYAISCKFFILIPNIIYYTGVTNETTTIFYQTVSKNNPKTVLYYEPNIKFCGNCHDNT